MRPCSTAVRLAFAGFILTLFLPGIVRAQDTAPVVTAPATVTGPASCTKSFRVDAIAAPGTTLTSLTATSTPSTTGSTFTEDPSHTFGVFTWTPTLAQTGTYSVAFTARASDGSIGSATTLITVTGSDRPPVVTAPASATVNEGSCLTIVASAVDPDGDPINCFSPNPVVPFGAFTTNAARSSGTFTWCPTFTQAGTYTVTFQACSAPCSGTGCILCGSATTMITVNNVDRRPVVSAPATFQFGEAVPGAFAVAASDPDGDAITSLTAASSPATTGSTFTTNASHTSGTFSWTPSFIQSGTYTVTFTATNALTGTAATTVIVGQLFRPPAITAPATVTGAVNTLITFTATAADPDGEATTLFQAAGSAIDAGGTFTSTVGITASGTFSWTPTAAQLGTYSVTFTACNSLCSSVNTNLFVTSGEETPVVTAPATVTRPVGCPINFTVTAIPPPGTTITALTTSPLPAGATFTPNATNTSGTFDWANTFAAGGSYNITFTAHSSTGAVGFAQTNVTLTLSARGPVVLAPASQSVAVGQCLSFVVTASDPDGDPINSFTVSPMIVGATFARNATNTSGTFSWCPTPADPSTQTVTFTACSAVCGGTTGCDLAGNAITVITVTGTCSPAADAGGPYLGVIGAPICFDGSGSSDPTGGVLTYAWDFGDGTTGTGVMVCHTYTALGTYTVTLTITSACGSDTDVTTATFNQICGTGFTKGGNKTLRLNSGKPSWCAQIEPTFGCYQNSSVIPGSIRMQYTGGTVLEIHAITDKTSVGGDANGNGIEEITACFAKEDLRQLFSGLSGSNDVSPTILMDLVGGGTVQASLIVHVVAGGSSLAATISPNPMNPEAVLVFTTHQAGPARAAVYDAAGRLVRTLVDESSYPAGRHDVRFDGKDSRGLPLASGIYFYRVTAAEGIALGRFAILK